MTEPFVNRIEDLRRLGELAARLGDPQHHHAALIGLRRIGKSFLVREFERRQVLSDRLVGRLSCDAAAGDLDSWTRHFTRALVAAYDKTFDRDTEPTRGKILAALPRLPSELHPHVADLFDELDKRRPAWDAVFEGSLLLPQRLAAATGRQVIMALDEFPSVLRFRRVLVPGLEGIVRDVLEERSPSVLFVLAGSAVRQMRDILEGKAPLLTRADPITVGLFDEATTAELVDARLAFRGSVIDPTARQELERVVGCHPYWTVRLVDRASEMARRDGLGPIELAHVEEAVWQELIAADGPIASVCTWIFDHSLTREAGDDRLLLSTIAGFPAPVRRAELAAAAELKAWNRTKLGRHVDGLIRAGLLVEYGTRENAVIGFADPVFATWVMRKAGEVAPTQADVVVALRKRIERQADEKSRWYETYIRAVLDDFRAAKRWPGTSFGPAAPQWIQLPTFTDFEMNPTSAGTTDPPNELDIYAIGAEPWLVEAKARQVKASVKDLRRLEEKAEELRRSGRPVQRLWFVALNGFNPEAENYAEEEGILITRGQQLQTMFAELQKRKKRRLSQARQTVASSET